MTPQQLRRRRQVLDPNSPLLEDFALQLPVTEDTVDPDLPEVIPEPDYVDQEDPVTRYSPYGVDEFNKLKETEPDELKRRGPWHQILGGLADMTTVTRGLVPNLVYHNYDEVMNQTGEYNRQKERADLESRNRGDSLRAGASAYGTDVQSQNNEWNQTVGVELEARKRGLAPVNEVPSSLLKPNAPVETINGKSWAPLQEASEVSFSYPLPNPETNTTDIVVLFKDGNIIKQNTGIRLIDRNPQTNTNSLIATLNELKQRVQDPNTSDVQRRMLASDITKIEKTLEDIQKFSTDEMENRARIGAKYDKTPDTDEQPYSVPVRESIKYYMKVEGLPRNEAELRALADNRGPKEDVEREPGLPTGAKETQDAQMVGNYIAGTGDIDPGFFAKNFAWVSEGLSVDKEKAYANLVKGNERIRDMFDIIKKSRRENVPGFLPSIETNLDKMDPKVKSRVKDYISEYNANYKRLQEEGHDLWYDPKTGHVLTPQTVMGGEHSLQDATNFLLEKGYTPYKFIRK